MCSSGVGTSVGHEAETFPRHSRRRASCTCVVEEVNADFLVRICVSELDGVTNEVAHLAANASGTRAKGFLGDVHGDQLEPADRERKMVALVGSDGWIEPRVTRVRFTTTQAGSVPEAL